jgi:hypothetical protein
MTGLFYSGSAFESVTYVLNLKCYLCPEPVQRSAFNGQWRSAFIVHLKTSKKQSGTLCLLAPSTPTTMNGERQTVNGERSVF